MDDFRLRVFIEAARALSFTRAAERLYITQPAVSKHIAELEARFRMQLFDRRGSHLELTEAGCVLLASAERVDDAYRRLQYEMSLCGSRVEGRLRIGASTTIAQYLLPRILARFTARFPEVEVSVVSGNSEEVEQALERHDIDLGLIEGVSRRRNLRYAPFAPDELVLVARTGGRYARKERVTAEELCTLPLVLRESGSGTLETVAAALGRAGIRMPMLHVVMRLGSTEGIKQFVRHSDAMAIVSVIAIVDELRSGTLRIVDVDAISFTRDFQLVTAEAEPAPLVGRFVDFAKLEL